MSEKYKACHQPAEVLKKRGFQLGLEERKRFENMGRGMGEKRFWEETTGEKAYRYENMGHILDQILQVS